jgi:hypothetical protein
MKANRIDVSMKTNGVKWKHVIYLDNVRLPFSFDECPNTRDWEHQLNARYRGDVPDFEAHEMRYKFRKSSFIYSQR